MKYKKMRESIRKRLTDLFIKYGHKQKHLNKLRTNISLSIAAQKILEDEVTADNVREILESLGYTSAKVNANYYCFNIEESSCRIIEARARQVK